MIFKLFEDPYVIRERARRARRNGSGKTVRPLLVFAILCLAMAMALPDHSLRAVRPNTRNIDSTPTLAAHKNPEFHVMTAAEGEDDERSSCVKEFFPCSASIWGNVLLMVFYGSILGVGAKVISDGAELLLEIMNPSVIGGFVLPVLGAVPDAAIIVMSGVGDDAQEKVTVGMGTLAGSTIMLLTLAWMASLWVGRCDIGENREAVEETLTRKWDLIGTGITVEKDVPIGAIIMVVTSSFYLIIQLPTVFAPEKVHIFALVGMIVCALGFIGYGFYQVFSTPANEQSTRMVHFHQEKRHIQVATNVIETVTVMKMLAHSTKQKTLRDLNPGGDHGDHVPISAMNAAAKWRAKGKASSSTDKLFSDPDKGTPMLSGEEVATPDSASGVQMSTPVDEKKAEASPALPPHMALEKTDSGRVAIDMEKAEADAEEPKWKIALRSFVMLVFGVGLVCVFSDPMCDTLSAVTDPKNDAVGGSHIGIPAFYVSFVVSPVCSNASELVSSLLFAMKKKKENVSMTYAQLYGAATMNNTLCLGVFLTLVFVKGLKWDFSAEVTVILFCEILIGVIGLSRNQRTFMVFPVCLLYFVCIGMVAFLENSLGWK